MLSGCGAASTSPPSQQSVPKQDPAQIFNVTSIEPDNGVDPLINFINSANTTIDVVIYQFNDPQIKQALINARRSGKRVRVLFSWQTYKSKNTHTSRPDRRLQLPAALPVRGRQPVRQWAERHSGLRRDDGGSRGGR